MKRIPELNTDLTDEVIARQCTKRPLFRVIDRSINKDDCLTYRSTDLRSLKAALWTAERSKADISDVYKLVTMGTIRSGLVSLTHVARYD